MSGWFYLALAIGATVIAQLFFKQSHRSARRAYAIVAIALFCSAVPCTLLATRELGIGRVYVASALSYVVTPMAAVWLFRERLRSSHWAALGLIVTGIIVYSI